MKVLKKIKNYFLGTSGLLHFIDFHPGLSIDKNTANEIHFFNWFYDKGLEFYRFVYLMNYFRDY
jgi:hypothetical protein